MEESSQRLTKLILVEIALLFVLVVLVTFLGSFLGTETFKDILFSLIPAAVTIIFILIATMVFLLVLQPIFKRALSTFVPSYEIQYTWQFIKYTIWTAALLLITFLIIGDTIGLSIFIGVLLLIFILISHRALLNFAGWLYIIFQHHIRIGDLVEVDEIRGRITRITIMNTQLVKTGEYVGEHRHTDKMVMLPNSYVFYKPIETIKKKSALVWDEIKILLPAETDHLLARDIVAQTANSIAGPIMRKHQQEMSKKVSSQTRIPTVPPTMVSLEPEGVQIVVTYFCLASEKTEVRSTISENIISEFNKEGIVLAFKNQKG